MQDAVLMTECNSTEQLVQESLAGHGIQSTIASTTVHVLFQILIHKLKYECQGLFGMNNVIETNDICMF